MAAALAIVLRLLCAVPLVTIALAWLVLLGLESRNRRRRNDSCW